VSGVGPDGAEHEIRRTSCVGLSPHRCWDEPAGLRGELLTGDALTEHAKELALAHGPPCKDVAAAPLKARFAVARTTLRDAYARLGETSGGKHVPVPAEEWLLDNSHVVSDQLREIEEDLPSGYLAKLPRLGSGTMVGYPRVYGLCLDYLRHTDARIDLEELVRYVSAYEEISVLTIGELWAVPIMLRMGLILAVMARAAIHEDGDAREQADRWSARLLEPGGAATLKAFENEAVSASFLVELMRRLRDHDAPVGQDWVRAHCAKLGTTPDELARQHHLRQAADQVSVGNAITSMRCIGAFSWNEFFERASYVEHTLRNDPGAVYTATDSATRDRCRHAIEDIARRSPASECDVAKAALELAEASRDANPDDAGAKHVGFYLIDAGRAELERKVAYRRPLGERFKHALEGSPLASYLGPTVALSVALLAAAGVSAVSLGVPTTFAVLLVALLAIPASEVALTLVNAAVSLALPPRLLAKLDFKAGIPEGHRTLVVVPCMLDSELGVERLLADLETRSLANIDENLHFALVTDYTDHTEEHRYEDAALLALAENGIEALNHRYPRTQQPRYFLFHRKRLYNPVEGIWMGWERKRGKLEELNRLLRGDVTTSFVVATATPELMRDFKYALTLDADTTLPRETARKLVATMAHPLNRPRIDAAAKRVVRGYGLLQPRVGTRPSSTRRTRFSRLTAGPAGIDPYTSAVSDVYQDLFAEGSYVGKGIYDIDVFAATLEGRVPENTLLSHDLFEGLHVRTALVTDIELLDDQPSTYRAQAGRDHRWVRGDWQLLPWLFAGDRPGIASLPAAARYRILDNLRRSLVAPLLVAAFVLAWFVGPVAAVVATAAGFGLFIAPIIGRLVVTLARRSSERPWAATYAPLKDMLSNAGQTGFGMLVLFDRALLMVDAIGRTLVRVYFTHRKLLEWTASSQAERLLRSRAFDVRTLVSGALSLLLLLVIAIVDLSVAPIAAPVLLAWAAAPLVVAWLGKPLAAADPAAPLSLSDRRFLRQTALRTWMFFERFVGQKDNFLPPDNFQEQPRPVVAHRTSPTNIGLYLMSTVSARDFSFITLDETATRLEATLGTILKLEKRDGHVLNWYDTTTLQPLEPLYVSTVDSGNLAGYLIVLEQAAIDLLWAPIVSSRIAETALDLVEMVNGRAGMGSPSLRDAVAAMVAALTTARSHLDDSLPVALPVLASLHNQAEELTRAAEESTDKSTTLWVARVERCLAEHLAAARAAAPWAETLAALGPWLGPLSDAQTNALASLEAARSPVAVAAAAAALLAELSSDERALAAPVAEHCQRIEQSQAACRSMSERFASIGTTAKGIVEAMSFHSLYDADRALFAIGYNVSNGRTDSSHYDLLASEARLASFVAISKGDVPVEHWFRLGRPRADLETGPVLLSWSGSMFEYLMPLLVMKRHDRTLLDETYTSSVARQIEYGRSRRVPWGVSESAYNTMDLSMTYQYRAFGVPGLGLKAGLGKDLVVAPYASVLASLVRPEAALQNLLLLAEEGLLGDFGFYEAIDFTAARLPPPRRSVIVRTFMAHHQGMSLVALDNVLNGGIMQERFHRDARVKATELLLEERIPVGAQMTAPPATMLAAPPPAEPEADVVDHVGLEMTSPVRAHLLGHAELSTLITATGGGITTFKGLDVHRYREDAALGHSGIFFYLRDVASGEFWSVGYQPTLKTPDSYDAAFAADRVEIRRRDGEIESLLEVAVSPEHPADVRRITITNHDDTARELELTTYTEVVLASRSADMAHPAFSSMFVEIEIPAISGLALARRRPRSTGEAETWLVQTLCAEDGEWQPIEAECSRARFIGRGNSLARPDALTGTRPFSSTLAPSLDPALALRSRVVVPARKRARIALTTALAPNRDAAVTLGESFLSPSSIARTFELAWADARVEMRHLGISGLQARRFQELLSFVVQPCKVLRYCPAAGDVRGPTRETLWAQGISGDLPMVVVRLDDTDFSELVRELVLAHELWRLNGIEVDLVVLNEEPSGYLSPVQDEALALIESTPAQAQQNQRGGVFLRRGEQLTHDGRTLLLQAARVVLRSSGGSLARQLRKALAGKDQGVLGSLAASEPSPVETSKREGAVLAASKRLFDNGIGGFSEDGREYVMTIVPGDETPAPWCNVLANPSFGSVISERGSSFTWSQNSQSHRLTPWSNDAVSDPSGELVLIRDDETSACWSATPGPRGEGRSYEVRHTQGSTKFLHSADGIAHELVTFVDAIEPVKVTRLKLTNRGGAPRKLSLFGAVEWVLGSNRDVSRTTVVTDWVAEASTILAQNPSSNFHERRAFFSTSGEIQDFTCDREELFGISASREMPAALSGTGLLGVVGAGLDPCAALHVSMQLAPGETAEVLFVLGEGRDAAHALELAAQFRSSAYASERLAHVTEQWDRLLGAVTVRTPDAALDLLANRWLLYQALGARIWGRTAFYQSGGAYGFRDQLQDVLALLHADPQLAREHILRSAARQFSEGDVQHWWHPGTGEGVRTRCSDDLVWLPYALAHYVSATGDRAILDVPVTFLESRPLRPGEDDLFTAPNTAVETKSIYEHATRALDAAITQGAHGLPLMGAGDWNDGMNRVGKEGKGESVWLAWFIVRTLKDFIPLAEARSDSSRVQRCRAEIARILAAAEAHAWDGQWYMRAIFDDGSPLGSSSSAECRVDAIAQSWAVLAGADPDRARTAMRSSEKHLVDETYGMMSLLTPPFTGAGPDPGYIRAYPAGVRENGGQYTHGVLWTALAETALGDGAKAASLLSLFNPIRHASDLASRTRYAVEPYVIAADVYSAAGLEGRGGWTWYTGSAAWMYRVFVEHVLGVQLKDGRLTFVPCIPPEWPGYEVDYRSSAGLFHIKVENPHGLSGGRVRVEVDGELVAGGMIPLGGDGRRREVRVVILAAVSKASPSASRLGNPPLSKS